MIRKIFLSAALCAVASLAQSPRIYNTVKTKLAEGQAGHRRHRRFV